MAFFEDPKVEDPKDKLEIYTRVWVMYHNKPEQQLIYSRTEVMNYAKNGTDIEYRLVPETCGAADWKAVKVNRDKIFKTRTELVAAI